MPIEPQAAAFRAAFGRDPAAAPRRRDTRTMVHRERVLGGLFVRTQKFHGVKALPVGLVGPRDAPRFKLVKSAWERFFKAHATLCAAKEFYWSQVWSTIQTTRDAARANAQLAPAERRYTAAVAAFGAQWGAAEAKLVPNRDDEDAPAPLFDAYFFHEKNSHPYFWRLVDMVNREHAIGHGIAARPPGRDRKTKKSVDDALRELTSIRRRVPYESRLGYARLVINRLRLPMQPKTLAAHFRKRKAL